ncbi:MAG: hypothetical protein Q9170_008281 [Blastenia crenularia]
MALRIKYQVDAVIGDPYDFYDSYMQDTVRPFQKLDTAYAILYFFGALEIAGWSALGLINAFKSGETDRTKPILLSLIAGPLLLRSAYQMGITIYIELQEHGGSRQIFLTTPIIYNLTSLVIYAAIVAIARSIVKSDQPPFNPNHVDPSYDPNFWGRNGNQAPNLDPKNQMAVNEVAPPVYQQHGGYYTPQSQNGGYPSPMGHGGMQYAPLPQHHMQYQQQPQPYSNQPPYQQQAYQNQQYQQYQSPGSPPPVQMHQTPSSPGSPPSMQRHHPPTSPSSPPPMQNPAVGQGRQAPSEVGGSSVSELSSPHAR